MNTKNAHVAIIGTRGIPAKYGGFETFAEELSIRLVKKGMKVSVLCDKYSVSDPLLKGVNLIMMPVTKTTSPIRYYFYSLLYALRHADIIIVTGTGGAFFYPINLIFRKIILTNTDGVEFRRDKWSYLTKRLIKFSEYLSVKLSTAIIADSAEIKQYLLQAYPALKKKNIYKIEYGAHENSSYDIEILKKYSLSKDSYFLVVARLVEENNIHLIIQGFQNTKTNKKLVIVGGFSNDSYCKSLNSNEDDRILFLGGIYDKEELMVIRYACFAYMHGHSVGGTNPSLLEALGSKNIIIAHDNVYNKEVTQGKMFYFSNFYECSERINQVLKMELQMRVSKKNFSLSLINGYYNWDNITQKYFKTLKKHL
tara:strand:+ start:1179 stop:2279 length:1101 start_codon:yes stop_codon:yes gene_type:complete